MNDLKVWENIYGKTVVYTQTSYYVCFRFRKTTFTHVDLLLKSAAQFHQILLPFIKVVYSKYEVLKQDLPYPIFLWAI